MNRNKLIYVAGKYSPKSIKNSERVPEYIQKRVYHDRIKKNIEFAREHAVKIWESGFTAIVPHLNTFHFEDDCNCNYEDYMVGDFEILSRCDGIYLLPNYAESPGALRERRQARHLRLPMFHNLKELIEYNWEVPSKEDTKNLWDFIDK